MVLCPVQPDGSSQGTLIGQGEVAVADGWEGEVMGRQFRGPPTLWWGYPPSSLRDATASRVISGCCQ